MPIPTWRLVLTGGAITILAVAGLGFAAASNAPASPPASIVAAETTAAPGSSTTPARPAGGERLERFGDGWRAARLLHAGRHLVHAEVTVTGRDGELVLLQLDHGTVQSIGGGSLTISEAGGGTVNVSVNDATIVRVARQKGDLGDVKTGAEIFVQSRVDGSTVLAKRILVIPAKS